jgi:hypothetical protein
MVEATKVFEGQTMFEIKKSTTSGGWEEWLLEKTADESEKEEPAPVLSFSSDIQTSLRLGRYFYHNLVIELSSMPIYGEEEDSIALSFIIGDQRIDSHGIYRGDDGIAISTDRKGSAIKLSNPLPDDFYEWLEKLRDELQERDS